MLRIKGKQGLSAGFFRDGDLIVNDSAWSDFDLKNPKHRAFVAKWAGTFVVILGGQDKVLAEAGLELRVDGRIIDKRPPATESKPPKK